MLNTTTLRLQPTEPPSPLVDRIPFYETAQAFQPLPRPSFSLTAGKSKREDPPLPASHCRPSLVFPWPNPSTWVPNTTCPSIQCFRFTVFSG
ncbi:hypothetical protein GE21DRAFT_1351922 [Neurospora crassa]|nr:hypothetical protein GE21DRAFT_1351922 [Neurospora crassa]